jgi:hypothetical protein
MKKSAPAAPDDADPSRRRVLVEAGRLTSWAAINSLAACAATPTTKESTTMGNSSEHDFDFLFGRWRMHHRRLRERLVDSQDWEEFDGTCVTQPILGGFGTIDDLVLNLPGGAYRAAAIRAFDIHSRRWAIWWLDMRNPQTIDSPVVGGFEDGVGTFYADDTHKGQPIRVRFRWTDTKTRPRWEQAFSTDGGETWEVNWTNTFVRMPMGT